EVVAKRKRNRRSHTRWYGITILIPKRQGRSHGDREALSLDVICCIARIGQLVTRPAASNIRVCPIVAAVGVRRIRACSPCPGKWYSVTRGKNEPEFPSAQRPACGARNRLGSGNIPGSIHYEGAPDVEIRNSAVQAQIEPLQT